MISQRAESALRKYSGGLSCAILCDGIYYLNAYADYRKGKLTADKLSLYADSYKWEIQGCGSGALRIRHEDYEMNIDGRKHTLDMHIKYGISSHSLIRIYFCWDNEQKKIIIGHMPDHLPTASQST